MKVDFNQLKENFNKACSHINREGFDKFLAWLENETDFFEAPSSSTYHGNYTHGLLQHSLNVTEFALINFNYLLKKKPDLSYLKESVILVGLFHDLCKTNIYKIGEKWVKNSSNQWKSYQGYEVKDEFPLGHGEKSLYILSQHIKVSNAEALAIRWHMSAFEMGTVVPGFVQRSFNAASEQPLVKLIHAADMMAVASEDVIDYRSQAENS